MVRETRHLWVGNLPDNVSKERIKEYFNRYGPVQSVKYLPSKDGEVSGPGPVSAVTVAFMDIKSACKALQTQHKLDERILKTDFYDPTSGDCGSGSVCPPTPEEKGGGPGGGGGQGGQGAGAGGKLDTYTRSSQHYYRGHGDRQTEYGAGGNTRQHPSSRYQEDLRHRPRPQYRSNSSFNQESVRSSSSSSSSYRNNYGWKDSRPRPDQTNYNSSDKCDQNRLVNNSKSVKGGAVGGGSSLTLHKKKHRTRRSRSNSSSDSQQSGSNSRSSSSSSSRSSSSGSGSSKSPSPNRHRLGKGIGLGHYLPHTDLDKLCTIIVRNLPERPTENALRDELSREYKKGGCVVRSVRIVDKRGGAGRSAIITFSDQSDVSKALEDSRNKRIFGNLIDVEKFSAHRDDRPRDGELSEFHPKATRTLFVGNISREVLPKEINERFKEFGEILEIDIKKPDYALVQFVDIRSVIKAIRTADGELIGGQRVRLDFGLSVATKCVWVDGVASEVSEKVLQLEFGQYGKIQDLIINRSRGHALVYFDQLKKATIAVSEVRGKSIHGSRLMTDYASHECRTAFFEHCKKSGMDIRERSKPWEQESDLSDRRTDRNDRIQRDRSNESRGSGTSRSGRKRDEYDEELRRFQTDRGKIETETERCFTPPYTSSRRGPVSGPSRSPSPPRSSLGPLGGPSPSNNSRSDRDRGYSDRDSVVSDGSRHGSPVSRDGWRSSRYKPRTQAISPPGESRSPAEPDADSRRKRYRNLENGDSGDYRGGHRGRSVTSNSSAPPQDPRIEAEQLSDRDKVGPKHFKMLGQVDSGLSEDTSSGSSGSVPDTVDNAKLLARARRSSTDSAVSREDTSSRPPTPSQGIGIPVYTTNNSSLLRVVPSLSEPEPVTSFVSAAPKTPVSPAPSGSSGSRPGTPLCDENPENCLQPRSVAAPVRLASASTLRQQTSSEPMSLPLPRFAQDRLSTSPGERSHVSHRSHQISPREPRMEASPGPGLTLKPSGPRPELSKLKIPSPTKYGPGPSSSGDPRARDPRLATPSLKSPGLQAPLKSPLSVPAAATKPPSFVSPDSAAVPPAPPSLSVKVGNLSSECKPKDPRIGLLTVAVPPPGTTSSPASPSPRLSRPRTPPLLPISNNADQPAPEKDTKASSDTPLELHDQLKLFEKKYETWSVLTRQQNSSSSRQDQSSRLNLDMRPSQPSAIAQQLLSRKSVFDEDSKRLEKTSEPSETASGPALNSGPAQIMSPVATPAPVNNSPLPSSSDTNPVLPMSDHIVPFPRDIDSMSPMSSMSPVRSSIPSKMSSQPLPGRQNSTLSPVPSSRTFFSTPVQSSKVADEPSSRPLPLPSKAGTSASAVTIPIKPLVDKMSKPAAFTKPSATVTPTLKSTGLTASSAKPTVFTTTSTKTVSTSTMVPSTQQFKNVEKGEASSTTCSPKPDSGLTETTVVTSSTPSQDTDSDPNVSSTTGLESKKKVDINNKDIKTFKKEFDNLTSLKEKKEIGEELFAPTATIIQQVKPKYNNKIEKKPSISSRYDIFNTINDVKKAKDKLNKDKILSSKEKKDKLKVKQRFQTNDLKDFLAADNKSTIKKTISDKKPEQKKDDKVEVKRRLSINSENEDSEPKAKIPKLKSDSDGESDAKKIKSEPMKPMGRIPKLEKKEDKRERTESVKSHDSSTDKDKDKHKAHSKSKSKHEDRHRHKSSGDKLDTDKNRDKHKKKKKEKDKDRDREKELKSKLDAAKSRSLSTDDDKHHKKLKKNKDRSKDKEKREVKLESKDKVRDKERKDKHRDKDKERERKRKKEDEERRKQAELQARKRQKRMEGSSNSDGSDDSSDGDERKFSIFDEPVFDENNPVYFSMYDKVKARRSCVKAREDEEQKRQEEALKKFAKLKEQRAKREGKKTSVDSDNDSMSGGDEDLNALGKAKLKEMKEQMKLKKKQSFINSSSDSEDEARDLNEKKKSKSIGSPDENRKHSFKAKRTVVDSSDDDSDEGQKPLISKSLSKIGLDSSDSDNNRGSTMDTGSASSQSNKKNSSYLETDSEQEGSDSKAKIQKAIKTESDHSDSSKPSLVKKKSKSVSDSDSDEESPKTAALAVLAKTKTKTKEKSSIKSEPLSTDSEDEKPDISKFNIKKETKIEKLPNKESKTTDVKSKPKELSKRDKKKSKDDGLKEKSLLGQKFKRQSLFGTSSEDESTARNSKPPTPNTSTSKLLAKDGQVVAKPLPIKLNIDQVYSDSDKDNIMDSPAIESDSSDGIPSRPPTPSFPTIKAEETKPKPKPAPEPVILSPKKEEKPPVVHERQRETDKMFDSLLTINVDCQSSKQTSKKSPSCSSLKSPGNLKSPGKSASTASGPLLSPGSHRSSPLISPGGKPTYLLAHMRDKAASMEAEKIHRAQESRELQKRVTEKVPKDCFKTRKDSTEAAPKRVDKHNKSQDDIEVNLDLASMLKETKASEDSKKTETETLLCLSETDSDSNESPKKESPSSVASNDDIEEIKEIPAEPRKSLENDIRKSKSKLSSRQTSDESTDDCSLVIDLESKKDKQSVFDFNDDSNDNFGSSMKQSLDAARKPLRETFKTSQRPSSYASFVAGTQSEASSSPSCNTEFKNVVIVPDDDSPPASNGVTDDHDKSSADDLVILDKPDEEVVVEPKKDELERSIASITDNKSSDAVSESDAAVANLLGTLAETDRKRTNISQEETESAVNALLGESFESFEETPAAAPVENMDEDVNNVADDEAAAAVAGLATAMSPEDNNEDWSRNVIQQQQQPPQQPQSDKTTAKEAAQAEQMSAEDKQLTDESIENIAAEIRRSSTDSEERPEVVEEIKPSSPPKIETKTATVVENEIVAKVKPPTQGAAESTIKVPEKRKDVFDFPDDEEEQPTSKPLTSPTKTSSTSITAVSSVETVIEEVVKTEMRQTRVIPVSRTPGLAPVKTQAPTLSSPSTLVTPVSLVSVSTPAVSSTPTPPAESVQVSTQSPLQPLRLSIDDKLSPSISNSSPSSRSPKQRMRRSTGGNSRESEEESAVTDRKIHLILEQAKQEAELAAHIRPGFRLSESGIPINLISNSSPSQQPELLIDPKTGQAVRLTTPASSVTLTLVTSQSQVTRAGIPQPTVLPPRNDQVRPTTMTRVVPAVTVPTTSRPAVAQVTPAPAVRQTLPIQLPTQPLPPESVRKTQPVLLEQNSGVTKVSGTSQLPRTVSLPTEPVPMSVANKPISLPRTPLPMSTAVVTQTVTSRPVPASTSRQQVVTTPAQVKSVPAGNSQYLSQDQGTRVSLGKREEQELDLKQKDSGSQQNSNEAHQSSQVKAQRDYLQPREREIHRPSSTPQPSGTEKDEKSSPASAQAAHVYPVAGGHPSMFESAGLDSRTLELLRFADYKYKLELTQQLLAAGYPEHMVPSYVEKIARERIIQETVLSQQAQARNLVDDRPGSVPPGMMHHLEEIRRHQQQEQQQQQQTRQPLPAHHQDPYRQSESPLYPGHVVPHPYSSSHPSHLQPPAAHQPMRLTQSPGVSDFSTRSRPASPSYPTTDYTLPHLAAYPICWTGTLGLKNDMANVRLHYVSGNRDLARASLPDKGSTLKIMQRMRLEDSQLDGVARKMETKGEHCVLLALPNGSEHEEIELQSRNLRNNFITYLQLKSAAGIVNVSNEDNQPAYIVHVFPSCDFANENLARIAPNLLHRVADIEHLVIVIATVFDVNR